MNDEEYAQYEIDRAKIEVMTEKEKIEKMIALQHELFMFANSFAGEETGSAAVLLHEACNNIIRAKKWLNRTIDEFDFDSSSLNMFGGIKNYVLTRLRKN